MSSPAVESAWQPRRLKVPRANRSLLVEPSLDVAAIDAEANHRRLTTGLVMLQGRTLDVLRQWSRQTCLSAAHAYTCSLAGEIAPPVLETGPVFIAGHQPSLYHPGVWVKNFAIDRLAKQTGGVSVNLIVDNDTLASTSLRVPAGTREQPSIVRVPFDTPRPVQPWEDADILDAACFESFAGRVRERMLTWSVDPLLSSIWPDALSQRQTSSRLCDCLTAARHRQERRWGLANLELPISRMCQAEPFLWFASHLIAHLARFRECHNAVLDEYRRINKVRSRNHPVPRLTEHDGWHEAPFWIWRAGEAQRHGVFAKQIGRKVHLSDGRETFAQLPLTPTMDACCAVEVFKELPPEGLRFRTRALTTTLFSRLCLGDLFVHGIGGAKYDEMTDQIIRRFYGLQPPAFVTMSATLHLPLAAPFAAGDEDRRRVQARLRDLRFNADRYGLGPEAAALIAMKQRLIAEQQDARSEGLSRRERDARRPTNRERHRQLTAVADKLARFAGREREAAAAELRKIDRELSANRILCDREFSFALYPEAVLSEFLSRI